MKRDFPWTILVSGAMVLIQAVLLTISPSPTVIFCAAFTALMFVVTLAFWAMT